MGTLKVQWGSEYRTSLVFQWFKAKLFDHRVVPYSRNLNGLAYLFPIQLESNIQGREDHGRNIRASSIKIWKDDAKSKAASESFSRDTAKLWNNEPIGIKNAPNLSFHHHSF